MIDPKSLRYFFIYYTSGDNSGNSIYAQEADELELDIANCMAAIENIVKRPVVIVTWHMITYENYVRISSYFQGLLHQQKVATKTHIQSVPPPPTPIKPGGGDIA